MGTQKASSTGKTGKSMRKNAVKQKSSKSVSKLSSIKQALFGGAADKKVVPGSAAKGPKKESAKPVAHKSSVAKDVHNKDHKAVAKERPELSGHSTGASKHAASVKTPVKAPEKMPEKAKALSHAHSSTPVPAQQKKPARAESSNKKADSEGVTKKGAAGASSRVGVSASLRGNYLEAGESVCREVACEGLATSAGYCRLHYIKNWKKIKRKEVILREGKLNQYIEELVAKYPDKYIEAIRHDLASDKDFAKVIYDLDLDESLDEFDTDGENSDHIIDSIKRDFDDDGDSGF